MLTSGRYSLESPSSSASSSRRRWKEKGNRRQRLCEATMIQTCECVLRVLNEPFPSPKFLSLLLVRPRSTTALALWQSKTHMHLGPRPREAGLFATCSLFDRKFQCPPWFFWSRDGQPRRGLSKGIKRRRTLPLRPQSSLPLTTTTTTLTYSA